jgi:hypothetical protein
MKTKTGFTLLDGMMLVLVMVTLSTALCVPHPSRIWHSRRVVPREALEQALMKYRVAEQRWPLTLVSQADSNLLVFREDNARVFAPLLKESGKYIDVSTLLTKVPGKGVMRLQDAMKMKIAPEACPLGYLDPANKEIFKYFKVTFNLVLDTVNVEQ